MDRFRDVLRHIKREVIFQSFREVLANLCHLFFYAFGYFHCIGARKHIDSQYGSIACIDTTFRIVRLCFERNTGYVTHTYQ